MIVFQVNSMYLYLPGVLTPAITTDKDVYHVGEEIHAKYSLINKNAWAVTFSTPVSYDGMIGYYEGETNLYDVAVNALPAKSTSVVFAGGEYILANQSFTMDKAGKFTISSDSVSITVEVLP